jgi:HK97 family phage portal protein
MGFLQKSANVVSPGRIRAEGGISRGAGYGQDFWYGPDGWLSSLALAGVGMTPELALTLSHVFSAVDIISGDFGTMPCGLFRDMGKAGRERVRFSDPGIGGLAYRVRWQPNAWQSAKGFWSTLVWQYLLRPTAYAEIVYRPGSDSIIDQLVPRHPDRVQQLRLSSGRLSYKLIEPNGSSRFLTEAEMFVVRNTSTDGLNAISRTEFGAKAIGTGLTLQQFTSTFFKKGITGALLATYKAADMEDEDEDALHKSITRYVGGAENAGGVLLVPEDIEVKALGVDPEKAQLLGLKDLSGRDVARLFKLPPYKLAIAGTQAYASQVQSAQDYVTTCQMPIVREFQDAIYIHLVLARDIYAKFNTSHLLQADQKTRMEAHEVAIRARVYRPSTAREMEDLAPDPELDALSAQDHRPGGQTSDQRNTGNNNATSLQEAIEARAGGASVKLTLAMHDNALRVLRRERAAVEKLAKKFASAEDQPKWKAGLQEFYGEHAGFVADTMRIPIAVARAYAAQHGTLLETHGLPAMATDWTHFERCEAEDLVELALEPAHIDRYLETRSGDDDHA